MICMNTTAIKVLEAIDNSFWTALSRKMLQSAWSKEDEVWDKIAER